MSAAAAPTEPAVPLPRLAAALAQAATAPPGGAWAWDGRAWLAGVLAGGDPEAAAQALVEALELGMPAEAVSGAVALQALLRLASLPTTAADADWALAERSLVEADAIDRRVLAALGGAALPEALSDLAAALLDCAQRLARQARALGPPAALPGPGDAAAQDAAGLLATIQQGLAEAAMRSGSTASAARPRVELGDASAAYLYAGGEPEALLACLERAAGSASDRALLAAAARQMDRLRGKPAGAQALVAATRALACRRLPGPAG